MVFMFLYVLEHEDAMHIVMGVDSRVLRLPLGTIGHAEENIVSFVLPNGRSPVRISSNKNGNKFIFIDQSQKHIVKASAMQHLDITEYVHKGRFCPYYSFESDCVPIVFVLSFYPID